MYIWDYMRAPEVFIDDPARILETLEVWDKERGEDIETILSSGRGIGEDFKGLSLGKRLFSALRKAGLYFYSLYRNHQKCAFPERTDQRQLQTDAGV